MTAQGSAYARFRRALDSRNATGALATATELDFVSLRDALELILLLVDDPKRFRRAALRWHARYCGEVPDVGSFDRVFMRRGGDDAFFGGEGRDDLVAPFRAGPIAFDLKTGELEGDETGSDSARNFETVEATNRADTLIGNDSNNYLDGAGGDDHIEGRGGRDRLYGDGGVDFLDGGDGSDECVDGETVLNCENIFP